MRETVIIGPFGIFFSNKNDEMGLRGHSHYATVTLEYESAQGELPSRGFPAFEGTYGEVQTKLKELTGQPFKSATNEEVARRLYAQFDGWSTPEIDRWGGAYKLVRLALAVMGVPDSIGHADGFTTYTVHRA